MILYRMAKIKHAGDLNGRSAELTGGRWNLRGLPALYLAQNISLAILETMVHCQRISDLYNRLVLSIQVPDESPEEIIEEITLNELPVDWNKTPWHSYTIQKGTDWLKKNDKLLLKIPSAVVPMESIFLANPRHKRFHEITIEKQDTFLPDNRLKISG
jgi:RES domain-containing protein